MFELLNTRILLALIFSILVSYLYLSNFAVELCLIYLPFIGLFFRRTRFWCKVFIGRALLPISIGFIALMLWNFLHSNTATNHFLQNSIREFAAIRDFLTILSTLYAICIAFLLWKGLTDYDNLRTALRDEASTIQSINELFYYLDGTGKNGQIVDKIRLVFVEYIENIVSGAKIIASKQNDRLQKSILGHVSMIKPEDENDLIALSEIIKELSTLSHIRALRSTHMETKMSPYLLLLLFLISSLLLIPFFLVEPETSTVTPILIFSLASFFSFLFITLLDINDPFDGYWQIKIDAFSATKEFLEKDMLEFNHES